MDEHDGLAAQFEAQRPHLRVVAYRMLGSLPEAEDAVQEGWLHLSRSDQTGIGNLRGWLTTVVARICLDTLSPAERLAFVRKKKLIIQLAEKWSTPSSRRRARGTSTGCSRCWTRMWSCRPT